MTFVEKSEYKTMSIEHLYQERENISLLMIEAEGEDLEELESSLETIEEMIYLKEAGIEELDFE